MVRTLRIAAALALAATPIAGPATASPDRQDAPAGRGTTHRVASGGFEYAPKRVVIFAGDSLEHTNVDAPEHDLVSLDFGPDGKPWFDSELIGAGETAPVPVGDVPPGLYPFTCSIHPFMSGTLDVRDPSAPPPPQQVEEPVGEVDVGIGDSFFAPKDITVPAGATVRWENGGNIAHSVTAADGSWDSSPACPQAKCMDPGEVFTQTFTTPGVFAYYCKLHGTPVGTGHAGTIRVVAPGSTSTAITTLGASASGTEISVGGSVVFGGEEPVPIAQDPAGDGPAEPGLAAAAGVDLTGAATYRPDPSIPSLFLEWRVADLPSTGSLPEGVRYVLPFRIGEEIFVVQAKLTNATGPTVAEDPRGHGTHAGRSFQLRGDCQTAPFANCHHLAWLNGSFDTLNDLVRVKVPLGVTPAFAPGAVLDPLDESGPAQIRAGFQVGPDGAEVADTAAWEGPRPIAASGVLLGIAPSGTPPGDVAFDTEAHVDDGGFAGALTAPGPGTWDVWARACFGANCTSRRVTVTA